MLEYHAKLGAMSDRSASPARNEQPKTKKQKTGGFKWKEKKAGGDEDSKAGERDSGGLERGYRNRSPRRDSYRERDRGRDRDRERLPRRDGNGDGNEDRYRDYRDSDEPRRRETDSYRPRDEDRAPENKRANTNDSPDPSQKVSETSNPTTDKPATKEKKPKKPKPPTSTEPMIVVNINDRLGTKAAIPCFASDSIKAFKAVVAMHIGRQPHEILLKRQGERPFKDQLTLEDYGVSSGVQLDLELDTGD